MMTMLPWTVIPCGSIRTHMPKVFCHSRADADRFASMQPEKHRAIRTRLTLANPHFDRQGDHSRDRGATYRARPRINSFP